MAFNLLSKLPSELRDEVVKNCAPGDQLAYARTCRRYHEETIPLLYRCVDISTHNDMGLFPCQYPDKLPVPADDPQRCDYDNLNKCEEKQQLFFKAIGTHITYAKYVLQLSWTVIFRFQWEDENRQLYERRTWETFGLLNNVRHLDFGSLAHCRELVTPPLLFPHITHLRLSGQMSFAVLRACIGSLDPGRLISLECNNLQDFGQNRTGEDLEALTPLASCLEPEDLSGDGMQHPGAMRGHLKGLEGKCSKLRHLCLRSVGQDQARDVHWSHTVDEARYKEWSCFLQSVRFTLRTLTIEQGLEVDATNIAYCRGWPPLQIGRPMDDRFAKYLLPTICGGPWPHLKYLKIFGVGSMPRFERNFRPGKVNASYVRETLHDSPNLCHVKLVVEEKATKTFFLRENGASYDFAQ